jgi:GNAT superfamily N-acetyltransferase
MSEIESAGMPFSVQLKAGRAPLTEDRARALGLTHVDVIEGMVLSPGEEREAPRPASTVLPIGSDEVELALDVCAGGFEAPREVFVPFYTPRVMTTPGLTVYLARVGDEPVATGVTFEHDGAMGIFNVATPPEHRRQGHGSQIVLRGVRDGFERGAQFAYLQASAQGTSVYRRLGFETVERYLVMTRPGP